MIKRALNKHEHFYNRIFEIIPGFLIWLIILSPFLVGKTFPLIMADVLIILSIYWFYRAFLTSVGSIVGYWRYRRAIREDWLAKCMVLENVHLPEPETLPTQQLLPKHLIVIPAGGARYDILKPSLDAIRNQNYPTELTYISISFEERLIAKDPPYFRGVIEQIKQDFSEFGDRIMIFEHPDKLEGEVIGAAANRRWGARNAVETLESRGEIIEEFLITSPDEDIVFHKEYLAAATYQYLISEKRTQKFYQTGVYTFNNNYWDVPILIRVLAASLTIPVMSSSVIEKHRRETYSCYTLSLDVLRRVDYWDPAWGIDDTTFYWRPFFYFNGEWDCEVFFIPLSADAVYDPNYIKNHRDQYKQYLRWGWGVISFPMGFKGLLSHDELPFFKRLQKILHLFEVFVFWKVLAYLLTFAIPLILLLNPQFNELVIWYTLPNTLSNIMGLAIVFLFPATIFKALIAPPKPENWSWLRYFVILLVEAPLNIVTLLTYSFLPFVEASTRMMFGQKAAKSATWTEKTRK